MKNASVPLRPRARATYEALLDGLERQIAEHGFDRATSTLVAERAGVSTGSFYAYFSSKDDALAALFSRCLDDLVDAVEAVLTADNLLDLGVDGTMRGAVDAVVDRYRGHAAVLRAALGRIPADERLRSIYWESHDRAVMVAQRFIQRGAVAGMVRHDQSAVVLAHALIVLTQSLHHPVIIAPQRKDLVEPLCDEIATTLTTLLTGDADR